MTKKELIDKLIEKYKDDYNPYIWIYCHPTKIYNLDSWEVNYSTNNLMEFKQQTSRAETFSKKKDGTARILFNKDTKEIFHQYFPLCANCYFCRKS